MRRVKLVKVIYQAHLVVEDEDGQVVDEVTVNPISVMAREWKNDYSGLPFEAAIAPVIAEFSADPDAAPVDTA